MKKEKLQDLIRNAFTMRLAGATMATISESTGLSVSSLYRFFKSHDIVKGEFSKDAILSARERLVKDTTFIDNIKLEIASSLADDLAISRKLKDAVALSLEQVICDSKIPIVQKTRALAAIATTLKLAQEVQRRALNVDKNDPFITSENIPSLRIELMSPEDIESIKNRFKLNETTELSNNYH